MRILRLSYDDLTPHWVPLCDLLTDAVDSGASIGFLPPLREDEAAEYWSGVADALRDGSRVLLVAVDEGGLIGCVQLDYAMRRNALHRAEIMKLMVHRSARRRGIGRALMVEAARVAKADGRTLLVLDTRHGDPSEALYRSLGYQAAGIIPRYARSASGELHATILMYLELESTCTSSN
ncbi:MAG TPA: GNAT family N-acetyltransferase [Bryobacteraceae bacterium]|jgi:ribosomal protein S18 acetylase RimI-like enzyme|nr:GNAT family N-acetyltransferase [Bryobacteraceae bacterium]